MLPISACLSDVLLRGWAATHTSRPGQYRNSLVPMLSEVPKRRAIHVLLKNTVCEVSCPLTQASRGNSHFNYLVTQKFCTTPALLPSCVWQLTSGAHLHRLKVTSLYMEFLRKDALGAPALHYFLWSLYCPRYWAQESVMLSLHQSQKSPLTIHNTT